jgi:uncharacterized protein YdbL (DUF1318 family)
MNTLRTITLGVLAAASVAGVVGVAHAQTAAAKAAVDAAKAQGTVGEQATAILGIVSAAMRDCSPPCARSTPAARRLPGYRGQNRRHAGGAGQATAEQLRAKLPSGQYFKPLNGGWTRK